MSLELARGSDADPPNGRRVRAYGARLRQLATERPDDVALVFAPERGGDEEVTWAELDGRATQLARHQDAAGDHVEREQ